MTTAKQNSVGLVIDKKNQFKKNVNSCHAKHNARCDLKQFELLNSQFKLDGENFELQF